LILDITWFAYIHKWTFPYTGCSKQGYMLEREVAQPTYMQKLMPAEIWASFAFIWILG
jgi:hypothetical protein